MTYVATGEVPGTSHARHKATFRALETEKGKRLIWKCSGRRMPGEAS
jgi:hypothetical protein